MIYNMSRIRDSLAHGRAQNLLCRSALLMSIFPFGEMLMSKVLLRYFWQK